MLWPPSDTQLGLLLVFGIIFVPVLAVCVAGFFLSHRPQAGRRLGSGAKRAGDTRRRPPDIAGDVRAAIERASQRLLQSAAEYKYVFPWMLTAMDAGGRVVFIRQYSFDSARRDGLRVDEVVRSPGTSIPKFPVAFRLVDSTGQDITWSMGVTGT